MHLTRRGFLMAAGGAAMLPAQAASHANVLVMLQLAGGNDGLNTVVPFADDNYARNRTTLRLSGSQVHKIADGLGLHSELQGFVRLLDQGRLGIVQGVGYQKMNRDHNGAMRIWQTADPANARNETGWMGRYADRASDAATGNVPAVFVGRTPLPFSLHAREFVVPVLRDAGDWTLAGSAHPSARNVTYPNYGLAQSLATVAQLMRAEIGIQVYLVELGGVSPGGFDNHSNQAGNHAVLLRELGDSLAAFCDDLARDGLLNRTLVATYSEFGRTLAENGRHGTGHGAAAPVFLMGGKVRNGLIGAHPSLADLEGDSPKAHTDFRGLYATLLERWLGVESEAVLGGRFDTLDLLSSKA